LPTVIGQSLKDIRFCLHDGPQFHGSIILSRQLYHQTQYFYKLALRCR
jgi:hypothetical protein